MQKLSRLSIIAAVMGVLILSGVAGVPGSSSAAESLAQVQAVSCPVVKMENWASSTREEKLAFLFGFASLLELEKEWQHNKPLPINQSIVGSWVKGLDGVTLGEMCNSIDRYAMEHPDQRNLSVLEVLGSIYVRPKMTQAELAAAAKRVQEIRGNR